MSALRLLHAGRLPFRHGSLRATARYASTSAKESNPVRTGLYATVFVVSTSLFAAYYFDARSAIHRYVFNPVLRYALDAEDSHKFAVRVLRSGFGPRDTQKDDEILGLQVCGYLYASARVLVQTDVVRMGSYGMHTSRTLSDWLLVSTRMVKLWMVRVTFYKVHEL